MRRLASPARLLAPCFGLLVLGALLAPLGSAQSPPEYALEVVGQLGSSPQVITASGDRLYLGVGHRVVAAELDGGEMRYLGASAPLPGIVRALSYYEGMLYAGGGERMLHVLDPRQPEGIARLATIDLAGRGEVLDIQLIGDTLYAVDSDAFLHLADISQPDQPWLLRTLATGALGQGIEGGELLLDGDYAYVRNHDGLSVIDVSDRHRPRRIARFERPISRDTRGMLLKGRALILIARDGLRIVDVSLPARPRQVADLPVARLAGGRLVDDRLYLLQEGPLESTAGRDAPRWSHGPGTLATYELSDPLQPSFVSAIEIDAWTGRIFAADRALYLAEPGRGLLRIDLSLPDEPRPAGRLEAEHVERVAVDGTRAALLQRNPDTGRLHLDLADIAEPAKATILSSFDLPRAPVDLALSGTQALALMTDTLQLIDFTRPASPTLAFEIEALDDAVALEITNHQALLVEKGAERLRVFDLESGRLGARSAITVSGSPDDLLIDGHWVYVSAEARLEVFEVLDTGPPVRRGRSSLDDPGAYPGPGRGVGSSLRHMVRVGDRVYGLIAGFGLSSFDLSDPDLPVAITPARGPLRDGLAADSEGHLFGIFSDSASTQPTGSLSVVDTRLDPDRPRSLWQGSWPAELKALTRSGERIYLAAADAGLLMLDPVPSDRLATLLTPRPSATAPPLPSPTPRPGEAERPFRLYLPRLQQPLPKSIRPIRLEALARLGGKSGKLSSHGPIVYLQSADAIEIIDTRNAAALERLGSLHLPLGPAPEWWKEAYWAPYIERQLIDLQVDGDLLIALVGPNPSHLDDIFDLLIHPARSGFVPTSQILTFDLSDPMRPIALGSLELEGAATALMAHDGQRYVSLLESVDDDYAPHGRLVSLELGAGRPRRSGSIPVDTMISVLEAQERTVFGLGFTWDGFSLVAIDTTITAQPAVLSNLPLEGFWPNRMTAPMVLSAGYAILLSEYGYIDLVDISNPRLPIELEGMFLQEFFWSDEDDTNDIETVTDARLDGEHLILIDRAGGLLVSLDLGAALGPSPAGSLRIPTSLDDDAIYASYLPKGWAMAGERLVISGGSSGGIVLVDPGPPPTLAGSSDGLGALSAVAAGDDRFYAASSRGLSVYDAGALPELRRLGGLSAFDGDPGLPFEVSQDIALAGNRLLIAGNDGTGWLELSSPAAPLYGILAGANGTQRDVALLGDLALVSEESGGLSIFALDDNEGDPLRARYYGPGIMRDVQARGDRAYVASGPAGLSILDLSSPSSVRELGFLDPGGYTSGVALGRSAAALLVQDPSDSSRWDLVTADLTGPAPRVLGRLALPDRPRLDLQAALDIVLVALDDGQLLTVDISSPERPSVAAELSGSWRSVAIAPAADRLYAVDADSGELRVWRLAR